MDKRRPQLAHFHHLVNLSLNAMSTPNAEAIYAKIYQEEYDAVGDEYTHPSSIHYDLEWADMIATTNTERRINEGDYEQGGED